MQTWQLVLSRHGPPSTRTCACFSTLCCCSYPPNKQLLAHANVLECGNGLRHQAPRFSPHEAKQAARLSNVIFILTGNVSTPWHHSTTLQHTVQPYILLPSQIRSFNGAVLVVQSTSRASLELMLLKSIRTFAGLVSIHTLTHPRTTCKVNDARVKPSFNLCNFPDSMRHGSPKSAWFAVLGREWAGRPRVGKLPVRVLDAM